MATERWELAPQGVVNLTTIPIQYLDFLRKSQTQIASLTKKHVNWRPIDKLTAIAEMWHAQDKTSEENFHTRYSSTLFLKDSEKLLRRGAQKFPPEERGRYLRWSTVTAVLHLQREQERGHLSPIQLEWVKTSARQIILRAVDLSRELGGENLDQGYALEIGMLAFGMPENPTDLQEKMLKFINSPQLAQAQEV